jgi:hypothetical protein
MRISDASAVTVLFGGQQAIRQRLANKNSSY